MKKTLFALMIFMVFSSHDMYLKMDTYFLRPNTSATIQLFNGTFEKSENVIDRDRMIDVSLVGNGNRSRIEDSQWSEKDSITVLNFKTGDAGTWVAGVSTAPRTIDMTATDFNNYLEHDGVQDMLDQRRTNNELEKDASEKYSKHVKTIFQVGDTKTNDWQTELGYPIEFIPLSNPYEAYTGDSLQVKLLFKGQPLANQLVYVGYENKGDGHSHDKDPKNGTGHEHEHSEEPTAELGHSHGNEGEHSHDHGETEAAAHEHGKEPAVEHGHSHGNEGGHGHEHGAPETTAHKHGDGHETEHAHSHENGAEHSHDHNTKEADTDHQHTTGSQLRTDNNGNVTVNLEADGIWYLRTIHLVKSEEAELTHESNWATLTFEVTHSHGGDAHSHGGDTHVHADENETGIPSYVFWIGSLLLIGGLFFWFNRKN
ncbi:MAG: DUF4198 domain-containing protein [Pricia sp.]